MCASLLRFVNEYELVVMEDLARPRLSVEGSSDKTPALLKKILRNPVLTFIRSEMLFWISQAVYPLLWMAGLLSTADIQY